MTTAALRGVAIQRGRSKTAFPAAAAVANEANALHGYTPVYYDLFLTAAGAQA